MRGGGACVATLSRERKKEKKKKKKTPKTHMRMERETN